MQCIFSGFSAGSRSNEILTAVNHSLLLLIGGGFFNRKKETTFQMLKKTCCRHSRPHGDKTREETNY